MPSEEPTMKCPGCGEEAHAEWVDNGFGPYAVQAAPFHCGGCGWVEGGCPAKSKYDCHRCISERYCHGKSLGSNVLKAES